MRILLTDGREVGSLDMVVHMSALGAIARWRVSWNGTLDMIESTTSWDSLHAAQTYVEGIVERQARLDALRRL